MVSSKNKRRLRQLAKRSGEVAKKAGSAYMNYSDAAAKKLMDATKSDAEEAAKIYENPEPNDPEDEALVRRVLENQAKTHEMLSGIQDDLSRPPADDPGMMGEGGHATGMGSDFGFGGLGSPDGRSDSDDEDWDPDGWLTGSGW